LNDKLKMMEDNQSIKVSLQNVSKLFGDVKAVEDINLDFAPGTLTTLLGPSGCGKTTLLRMIAGLEIPSSGHVLFGEEDVTELSATDRDVGMVFQSYALFPHMNVRENIGYGLDVAGVSDEIISERVAEVLNTVGLSGYGQRYADEMSGGQQQRVAVARSLIAKPKVLLFDEPLSNIDSKLRRSMREDIRRLQQETGITSIYVTHDQSEALAVSDEVVVMNNAGGIEQQGDPEDLYQQPKSSFVATFIGDANILDGNLVSGADKHLIELGGIRIGAYSVPPDLKSKDIKVAIRPEVIRLHESKDARRLECQVLWYSFVGGATEYTLESSVGDIFAVVPSTEKHFKPGDRVYISIADVGVAVLQD
jgi:iron(III) transport system ATP-binding protein